VADRDDLAEAYREFIREITLRFERAMKTLSREIREELRVQREENRRYFEALHVQGERESKRIDELIEESRAQRQALLHVLDRLDNGGPAPAV
jgi:predicted phage gp36 major capsid-like protein